LTVTLNATLKKVALSEKSTFKWYVEEEGRNAGVCVIADILVGLLAC
jgi:hypothetical protein